MSDEYLRDEDLLSILEDSTESTSKESSNKASKKSDVEIAMSDDTKSGNSVETAVTVHDLQSIVDKFSSTSMGNPGSGDVVKDLSNWFDGVDTLPSDNLNSIIANAPLKMDYGLTHSTLTSFKLMAKLRKFIEEDAFDLLFSESAIMGIDSEEILDRVKTAFAMYKELGNLTMRSVQSIKDYNLRNDKESTDVDKLSLLLGSISSDKLQSILSEIAYNKKEDKIG